MSRVALGMSGGVDSSVAVHLLQEQGHEVVGVHMLLGEENAETAQGLQDARAVAEHFSIPLHVFRERVRFEHDVIQPFIRAYVAGQTPNPCVRCNATMKFGRMWEIARSLDCTHLATGHYVQLHKKADGCVCLGPGADPAKDQSYFLYGIPADVLPRLVFPLGPYLKVDVRRIAAELALPVAEKYDSQEICFIPEDDYTAYLESVCAEALPGPGAFIDTGGTVIGRHGGIHRYTIGQRKGLGLALGYPAYVTAVSTEDNTVTVGDGAALWRDQLIARACNFHQPVSAGASGHATAKIRSRDRGQDARWHFDGETLQVHFDQPVRAITAGQSVVLYDGNCLVGGGIIVA